MYYLAKNNLNMDAELLEDETLLGFNDISGEGIYINFNDGTDLIHQEDLIILIDELKNAGAQAISVNEQRIIDSSYIYCDGTVILIDGTKIGTPFSIKAIGNSEVLYNALNRNKGYISILKNDGISIELVESDNIKIGKTNKSIINSYTNLNKLDRLVAYQKIVGKSDVYGSGITITIDTSKTSDITAINLLQLLNDLKAAGASAISINDNRILNMTDIMDINKQYILVDSNCVSSPYEIKALGNIDDLTSGMELKNSTISKLKSAGISVEIDSSKLFRIDKYTVKRGQSKLLYNYINN